MFDDPIAYFVTWTTYGTWLPGDSRWWVQSRQGHQPPNYELLKRSQTRMKEPAFFLSPPQRQLVEATIRKHCEIRHWKLWIANCRTNHVHVVVSGAEDPHVIATQFKAWCTRRLKEQCPSDIARQRWWTEGASTRYINDDQSLGDAITYVRDCQ